MKAINPKHQSTVNKAISWLVKYNTYNNLRDDIENADEELSASWRVADRNCGRSFDMFLTYCDELPKAEVSAIKKSDLY